MLLGRLALLRGEASEVTSALERVAMLTAIRAIASRMGEIDGIPTAIASAVEEQSAASGEISRNVQETAKAIQDISLNIVTVTEGVGIVFRGG